MLDLSRNDWMKDAICRGKTELFFSPPAERPAAKERREAQARELCSQCPVQNPCFEAAHQGWDGGAEFGMWSGVVIRAS